MRYSIFINQPKALEWSLKLPEAVVFQYCYELHSWADSISISGKTFYFASKTKIATELPLVSTKPDTIYRHIKSLVDKNLIDHLKVGNKDYVRIIGLGKEWNQHKSDNSENFPNNLGNSSDINSEIHPTYYNTNKDNKKSSKFSFKNSLLELGVEECIVDDWLSVRKTKKATNTKTSFDEIKNQIKISGLSANDCIKIAVEKDWRGFKSSWLKNISPDELPKQSLSVYKNGIKAAKDDDIRRTLGDEYTYHQNVVEGKFKYVDYKDGVYMVRNDNNGKYIITSDGRIEV